MKGYFRNYLQYLRECSTGLLIAPFSNHLWGGFVDSLVNVFMTILTFALLIVSVCVYPLAVPLFALLACESERRDAKSRKAFLKRMSRGDCLDWSHEADPKCSKGSPQGVPGYRCSRAVGHDGPCALREVSE